MWPLGYWGAYWDSGFWPGDLLDADGVIVFSVIGESYSFSSQISTSDSIYSKIGVAAVGQSIISAGARMESIVCDKLHIESKITPDENT